MPPETILPGSEPYTPENLLDRVTPDATLQFHYRLLERRERAILTPRLGLRSGRVLSVGCGWHPGRHLFPAPEFHLTGIDIVPLRVESVLVEGLADAAYIGAAGGLEAIPEIAGGGFDVVLYRLVLHHVVFQQPLAPVFAEAARLLAPGGTLVAIEPGLWHPVGAALALANRFGAATALHGTPDDVPLSPAEMVADARAAGLEPELHAVTFAWRRLPVGLQRALSRLDAVGSRPRSARLGHTLMLIARKPV